jgi:hypothetical protein
MAMVREPGLALPFGTAGIFLYSGSGRMRPPVRAFRPYTNQSRLPAKSMT